MLKKVVSILLVFAIWLSYAPPASAHETSEHNEEIELVLFGSRSYKTDSTNVEIKDRIQAIENAVYLCVDQFNGAGKAELDYLVKERKIKDIAKSIEEIDYKSNYSHRSLTHRGWNVNYAKKANWPIRKQILMNTVKKELFSSLDTPVSWFPWLSNKLYWDDYKDQCESFCILLYCVHILGDHIAAGEEKDLGNRESREKTLKEKTTALAYIMPLAHTSDRDNPGLIPELIHCCNTIFKSQSNTRTYMNFIQDLEKLESESEKIYESKGGVNTEDKFKEYNGCANELLDVLEEYVPGLLKQEAFFKNSFYN